MVLLILAHLDPEERVRARAVSREWRALVSLDAPPMQRLERMLHRFGGWNRAFGAAVTAGSVRDVDLLLRAGDAFRHLDNPTSCCGLSLTSNGEPSCGLLCTYSTTLFIRPASRKACWHDLHEAGSCGHLKVWERLLLERTVDVGMLDAWLHGVHAQAAPSPISAWRTLVAMRDVHRLIV